MNEKGPLTGPFFFLYQYRLKSHLILIEFFHS
jgi:hypothetical protein